MGPEAQQRGLEDCVLREHAVIAFGVEREVDDHDAVLLHDANEQDNADDGDHIQVLVEEPEREQRADTCGGKGGEDCDGMNEALVEDAQHDIDSHQRGEDKPCFISPDGLVGSSSSFEAAVDTGRHLQPLFGLLDGLNCLTERVAWSHVEGEGDDWELSLVVDRQR